MAPIHPAQFDAMAKKMTTINPRGRTVQPLKVSA
jgi:hypothetical protein